jgi:phosphinothricin acetyltransferase
MIRLVKPSDSKGILAIYAPYIENTSFTFETVVPTLQSFSDRITTYLEHWPWLVSEIDGQIVGYAYGSRHRERSAYHWCVETSIYVHDDFLGKKIGKDLYEKLISILTLQGFRNIYAVINLPNKPSVSFHERMGFKYFATYEKVGYKLGKWKNVGWWQLTVNDFVDDPPDPIKFSDMNKNDIELLLNS